MIHFHLAYYLDPLWLLYQGRASAYEQSSVLEWGGVCLGVVKFFSAAKGGLRAGVGCSLLPSCV